MKIELVNWCCSRLRQLVNLTGVEGVETDCKNHKVVVKGEKADLVKVVERVQRKSHRQVELKQVAKTEEKKHAYITVNDIDAAVESFKKALVLEPNDEHNEPVIDVMYDFEFLLPPDYALVIRALGSLEGTAKTLDLDFKVVESTYPFVIGRLLADPHPDMRKILRELIIRNDDSIRWNRLEQLRAHIPRNWTHCKLATSAIITTSQRPHSAPAPPPKYGALDILINNAGVNFNASSENSVEFAEQVIATNYFGTKNMIKALTPLMRPSAAGARIVNVSSRLGRLNGRQNVTTMTATQAILITFWQQTMISISAMRKLKKKTHHWFSFCLVLIHMKI